jgi:hypothetical protein
VPLHVVGCGQPAHLRPRCGLEGPRERGALVLAWRWADPALHPICQVGVNLPVGLQDIKVGAAFGTDLPQLLVGVGEGVDLAPMAASTWRRSAR